MQIHNLADSWVAGVSATFTKVVPFDSSSVMRIGQYPGGSMWSAGDRIYSVELRTGLDPAAGTVLWRFDANDYPGTGTSYADPRGRTWTLTNALAITKARPPQINDVYVDTTTDIIYRYDGATWVNSGSIGGSGGGGGITQAEADTRYVNATGDTVGPLVVNGTIQANDNVIVATGKYVEAYGPIYSYAAVTNPYQSTSKTYVDDADTASRSRSNHTGTQSADTITDGTTNKTFSAAEDTKLAGIATGATANSSDATLLK